MQADMRPISRRSFLVGGAAFTAWAGMPRLASAAGAPDPRYLTIILRGGLDGLAAVAPVGDPHLAGLRDDTLLETSGQNAALPLDADFVLNPALTHLKSLYDRGQASIVHAVATPYRGRSHFVGQDQLEMGLPGDGRIDTGWLNRAVLGMPSNDRVEVRGLVTGPVTPLILRGEAPVLAWLPDEIPEATDDTELRLLDLYQHTDPALHRALSESLYVDDIAGNMQRPVVKREKAQRAQTQFSTAAAGAAQLMSDPNGPRVGVLSFVGWDTHQLEGAKRGGRLFTLLRALDNALETLETGFGPIWKDTVVTVVTEFGRTVKENGTDGTDHGTATVAFLTGGAVKGGRILGDWPGLGQNQLLDGRDLAPTTDLRAVFKGTLRDHMGIDTRYLGTEVFPDSLDVKPLEGLLTS